MAGDIIPRRTLRRASNHVGNLANNLKDLAGGATLLNELVQNADDARADEIRFSATDDGLIVWNPGTFTDCGAHNDPPCPHVEQGQRACDLHSFQDVSGRNKEFDAETTGAFGIGFTAVYQVTDSPSLIFNGDHLLVDDGASRDEDRLEFCDGSCGLSHARTGTTLALPWARDNSRLRRVLQVDQLSESDIETLMDEMHEAAAHSLLFLRSVRSIVIEGFGRRTDARREEAPDGIDIVTNGTRSSWLVVTGRVEDSEAIKHEHPQIGPRRNEEVRIALPRQGTVVGRVYATLPTQERTGWSGHVDATFYPRQDRKGIEFDSANYRGRWNEALIKAAANTMATHLEAIATTVGAPAVWRYLLQAESISKQVQTDAFPPTFQEFATQARLTAATSRIALTTSGDLVTPRDCLVCLEDEDYAAAGLLSRLGQPLLHAGLRADAVQLSADYAPERLTLGRLVRICLGAEITGPWRPGSGPLSANELETLLALVQRLQKRAPGQFDDSGIASVALVPCVDGTITAAERAWSLTEDEQALFVLLDPELSVLDRERLDLLCPSLVNLCPSMTTKKAVELFARAPESLAVAPREVLEWLADRPADFVDEDLRDQVRGLPIFPTALGGHRPLTELSLPSAFEDPLGIAALVDRNQVHGLEDFLRRTLACRELDLVDYLETHLIPATQAGTVPRSKLGEVLALISRERVNLEGEHQLRGALSQAPLVLCGDGVVRSGGQVHAATDLVTRLDPATPVVHLEQEPGYIAETLIWLGVHTHPSNALISYAAAREADKGAGPDVDVALAILESLPEPLPASVPADLQTLTSLPWMPVEGGGGGVPRDLYAAFRLEAFASQGPRVGIDRPRQNELARQMEWVGVNPNPTTAMVVAHLRHCVGTNSQAHDTVYQFLSEPRSDGDAIRRLRDEPCVQVAPGKFAPPSSVFWSADGLGSRAHLLGAEHQRFRPFFDLVGVSERPAAHHLELILRAISRDTGSNTVSQEDELVVRRCWELLDHLLDDHLASEHTRETLTRLRHVRCVIDPRDMLEAPQQLRFLDGRRLAERFDVLRNNVIRRRYAVRALTAAGVARAEDEIETVLDSAALREPSRLGAVIVERLPAIRRLMVSAERDPGEADALARLEFNLVPELTVHYVARFAHQEEHRGPYSEDALYLHDEKLVLSSSETVSRSLARELMRCLAPDTDDGTLASPLFEVLQAASLADAMILLDEYGVPDHEDAELAVAPTLEAVAPGAESADGVGEFDGGDLTGAADAHSATAEAPEARAESREGGSGDVGAHEQPETDIGWQDRGESLPDSKDRWAASKKTDAPSTPRRHIAPSGEGGKARRRQSRLVSYVILEDDASNGRDEDPEQTRRRDAVDRAGIQRVLNYERSCGRSPEEQEHGNPGFDLVSKDSAGNVVRWIEVKSTGAAWDDFTIALSRTQMDENRERGHAFWLYVVENAEDDAAFRVHRIQDPWKHANRFAFDPGWRAVAEPDLERDDRNEVLVTQTRRLLGWPESGGTGRA